jgi:hypothetical protein
MEKDPTLDTLLDLDGAAFYEESGYWYKFEIYRVAPSPAIPHGLRYNLTLHDHTNRRVLGFDNAHAARPSKGKGSGNYKGRIIAYDHVHYSEKDRGTPYRFKDAQTLLMDFFAEIDKRIKPD